MAGAHDSFSEFEDGDDTYVGERGVRLSGGQNSASALRASF
jgi:ABC-type multidrug transport system fused ATPase/permease subunit